MSNLQDILTRLQDTSDLLWIVRNVDFRKSSMRLSHNDIKKRVLESEVVRAIEDVEREENSTERNRTKIKLTKILNEIGYKKSETTIRLLAYSLVKLLRRTVSGILVNESNILKLKQSMKDVPVVLVPTHRSYSDFVLMAFICFFYGIEIPCVAAGVDFLAMSVVGEMLRKTKAFFLRRQFHNDEQYKTIFAQYVSNLVVYGDSPVEFFIEGKRSRDGKSLLAKFGFLKMILRPFVDGLVPDIIFVPVSITYDRFVEEQLFANELVGSPKLKESTKQLLKARSIVKENYGNVYVNFGDAISARDWLTDQGRRDHVRRVDVKSLAFHIIDLHTRLQVIATTHLIMAVVYHSMIIHKRTATNIDVVRRNVTVLRLALRRLGVHVHFGNNIDQGISSVCSIHSKIIDVKNHRLRFSTKNDNVLTDTNACILLILYVNPIASLLFCHALMLVLAAQGLVVNDTLRDKLNLLNELYSYEFPIVNDSEKQFEFVLQFLLDTMCLNDDDGKYSLSSNSTMIELLFALVSPYLTGYFLLCEFFLESPFPLADDSLTSLCVEHLTYLYNRRILDFSFCLTVPFSSKCCAALKKIGCFRSSKDGNGREIVSVNRSQMEPLRSLLGSLISNPMKRSALRARV